MKRIIALLSAASVVALVFASCAKKPSEQKPSVTEAPTEPITAVTNVSGEGIFPVTDGNGDAVRNGESVAVYATDANGNPIADKTEWHSLENAYAIGKKIEMPSFRITVPEGWSDARSSAQVNIGNAETLDMISVSVVTDMTLEEKRNEIASQLSALEKRHASAVVKTETVVIGGEEAEFSSGFIKTDGAAVWLGYITFSHAGEVYDCRLSADRDLSQEEINKMVDILISIEFVK